jgi:hypothetical protein
MINCFGKCPSHYDNGVIVQDNGVIVYDNGVIVHDNGVISSSKTFTFVHYKHLFCKLNSRIPILKVNILFTK